MNVYAHTYMQLELLAHFWIEKKKYYVAPDPEQFQAYVEKKYPAIANRFEIDPNVYRFILERVLRY